MDLQARAHRNCYLVFDGSLILFIPLTGTAPILIAGLLRTLLFAHLALLCLFEAFLTAVGRQVYIPHNWSPSLYLIATVPGFLILAALCLARLPISATYRKLEAGALMSDGIDEREERKARLEEEKRTTPENRVDDDDVPDDWEPERVDS